MAPESGGVPAGWPRVSVVIPTLNEARNLPHVFARLPAGLHEVIVVDGHSVDGTLAVARNLRPDVRIVLQTRKGKGNALACGFAAATGDIIAMVDADGSADPGEIPRFVQALTEGSDFAKGTRYASGGGSSDLTHIRSLGNRVLSGLVNLRYRTKYSDLCYGYNVFWRRVLPVLNLDATSPPRADALPLWGDGFEVETLINIRIARARLTVTEVPSFEHSRIHGLSNLNAVRDGLRVLRTIISESRRSARPAGADAPQSRQAASHESAVCAPGGHESSLLGNLRKAGAAPPHPPARRKARGPGRPSEPAVGPTPLL
jgi:glycosyltransferase involved in cell wall biosynthesis